MQVPLYIFYPIFGRVAFSIYNFSHLCDQMVFSDGDWLDFVDLTLVKMSRGYVGDLAVVVDLVVVVDALGPFPFRMKFFFTV